MAETLEAQLTRVQAAIARIEEYGAQREGQGRRVMEAELKRLYDREADLLARIAASANSGSMAITYASRKRPV